MSETIFGIKTERNDLNNLEVLVLDKAESNNKVDEKYYVISLEKMVQGNECI